MNKDELSTVTDHGTHLLTAAIVRDAHEIVALLLDAGAKITGKAASLTLFQIRKLRIYFSTGKMLHQAAHFDAINSLKLLVQKVRSLNNFSKKEYYLR